jgi:hypothetical protein
MDDINTAVPTLTADRFYVANDIKAKRHRRRWSSGIYRPGRQNKPTPGPKSLAAPSRSSSTQSPPISCARLVRERERIERHVDRQKLELLRIAEQSERELLVKWAATYGGTTEATS